MVNLATATFIGEGTWYKNSAFRVYKAGDKYYSVVMEDQQNKYLVEETIMEIREDEIEKYIGK